MEKINQKTFGEYKNKYLAEQEGIFIYKKLAQISTDENIKILYNKVADIEEKHSLLWVKKIEELGELVPQYTPDTKVKFLLFLSKQFGINFIMPILYSTKKDAMNVYDYQHERKTEDLSIDERPHTNLFKALNKATQGGLPGPMLSQLEGKHKYTGGNELRAAVLGASDGLTSNLSLVMGVAGFSLSGHAVLISGLAGLVAGALSMAIGEYLSVASARGLYAHQIAIEHNEMETVPNEEREELSLIYQAKGLTKESANDIADTLMKQKSKAIDTLTREELGIDPDDLGGSAWGAAITSFFLFSIGAVIPVLPFIFGKGGEAAIISIILSAGGFFLVGAGISFTTTMPLLRTALRQVFFGLLAATITFALGKLVGKAIS